MANLDAAVLLARLDEVTARLRAASHSDEVLERLADEARSLAGVEHAWAARLEGPTPVSVRSSCADGASTPAPSAPPFSRLFAGVEGRSVARIDGFVVASLLGSNGAEGMLVLSHPSDVSAGDVAALDHVLRALATVAGLALESARLRAGNELVLRARELLLASVSHDLRNPLNTFAMSAGLLRDDLERNDIDTARGLSLVSRMERATSRMQGLIEDLIEASRIDARKFDLVLRDEAASQLLADAMHSARPGATERVAAVTCDTLEDDVRVVADRARTLQLLAKVIAFEAKATGDGGTIRLGLARQGDSVLFTARAIGPGGTPVPPPEEGRGGLALLIARGLVEAQRGTFRVEPTEGLVVAFTLPSAMP